MTKADLRVFAADDEPLSLRRAVSVLESIGGVAVVGTARNGRDALAGIRALAPDVALLDIEMPVLDGLDVIDILSRDGCPLVIFLTAHDHYATRAFEIEAVDYVLKPLRAERLASAISRARRVIATQSAEQRASELDRALTALRAAANQGAAGDAGIWVRRHGEQIRVPLHSIDWIEAQGDYVMLHCGDETYLHRQLLKDAERALDPASFVRVHRSAIARIAKISRFIRLPFGGTALQLSSGRQLNVGRRYGAELRLRLARHDVTLLSTGLGKS